MDDLADILTKIHTKENADADWKFITKQIREMPPYRVPQLWGALLQNLARDPPVMPPGYTTSDQWLSMCQAQYHELYRCACKDAGMEVSSVGNSGGRVEGGVNTSSTDLTAITSQLAAATRVNAAIGGDISSINKRHDELRQMIESMKKQQNSEQDTIRQIITDMAANKVEGDKKLEEVSVKIEENIDKKITEPIKAVSQQIDTVMQRLNVGVLDVSTKSDEWIQILDMNNRPDDLRSFLIKKSKFLLCAEFFKRLHPLYSTMIDMKTEMGNKSCGSTWFWKKDNTGFHISKKVMDHVLKIVYMFPKAKTTLPSQKVASIEYILTGITNELKVIPLTSSLLALLLNVYCYENRLDEDSTNTQTYRQDFNYDDIPFKPEFKTDDGRVTYNLCGNVWIEASLALLLFKNMYESQKTDTPVPCPFEKHLESSTVPKSPTGPLHAVSTLNAEWDADEWFETELSNPSKQSSQIQADKWFSSIATTINERSASPRKQLEQRSASPTKADIWFTSIASTISKRSASPSKRSASPSKVPLSTRSISPTAATLTSS
jgi:hypothetical protein